MKDVVRINKLDLKFISEGKGENILFIHGLNSNYGLLKKLILELSNSYKCWCLNFPKYGDYKVEDYVQILKQFLKIKKIKNPIFIGHSLGGIICLKLIEERIEYKSLIMINTPLIGKAPKIVLVMLDLFNFIIRKGVLKSYLEGFRDVTKKIIKIPEVKINKPFLVVYGNYDFLIKITNGECYEDLKPTKVVYGNFGHLAPLTHYRKLSSMIETFLNL